MNNNSVNEILRNMKSFSREKYQKTELLNEMFELQKEMVELTFNEEHAALSDLKIWDVERHLEQLNRNCGNVANEELMKFKNGSKDLCHLIKAEISGNRGEAKAFRAIQDIKSKNAVLKNVELSDGISRTELDAVVITRTGITIVEVKNTSRNIFIDDNGNYYRTGEFLKWDCNIAEKMDVKETMLRKILEGEGLNKIQIQKIVVFTDSRVEVQNRCPDLRTCFISQLAYIIDNFSEDEKNIEPELDSIAKIIKAAESKDEYPFKFDVAQYKKDFATLMVKLEEASTRMEELDDNQYSFNEEKSGWNALRETLTSWCKEYGGKAITTAAVACISTLAMNTMLKKNYIR